jgi:isopentenyl diphosphate isomerase/L-lactate dehydrogenase-like FMN-dependent dehydrogenase
MNGQNGLDQVYSGKNKEREMPMALNNEKMGDANQITREYFDSLLIEMRHLDAVLPSTKMELYGESFATPIMTAALSHLDSCRPGGAAEMAKGAFQAGAVMWTGMGEEDELEAIIKTGARTVKIIKPHLSNDVVFKKIEHAEKCGALAVGMDIDHAFNGRGKYDNVRGLPMIPKTLDEIKTFVRATKLPFIIKGVLSEQDALKCAEAGVRGIVVSHHHGILDYAVPPLMVLPRIVKALGGNMPIFVDCGVSSGIDAFKALALGATAVCVGRALMDPLKDNGAEGVSKKIEDMTEELAGAMARTCSPDITGIDPSVILYR